MTSTLKTPTPDSAHSSKVTVLMSVYNGGKYVGQAIESILYQTFPDFEFIIINDGSTDGTVAILQSYHDPRIKIITNGQNIGLTKSLNKGLQKAQGEYIARQDADDISLPKRLEKQVAFMEENTHVGLLGSSWSLIDKKGREIDVFHSYEGKQAVHFMCHGTVLIRKTCLDDVGTYREIFEYAQDYDLFLRIAEKFTIKNLKDVLYKLRIRDDSISVKKKAQQSLYASLVLELAEERRKTGRDRVYAMSEKEVLQFRKQWLNVSKLKKKRLLARNYSIWGQAFYELGQPERAFHYAVDALKRHPFNYQPWKIGLTALFKKFKKNPIDFMKISFAHLLGNNWYAQTLRRAILLNIPGSRKQYWNYRAKDIDEKWGKEQEDYAVLRKIIFRLTPSRILDIGCGSGRLFPLYQELHIQEVIAQDLASEALAIAKQKYQLTNISITSTAIENLSYPHHYFDLIISNRVLQHIPPGKLGQVIEKLTELGTNIYINEMAESDYTGEAFYLFKHDYFSMFDKYHFHVAQQGSIGQQTWMLFEKKRHENC